LFLWERKDALDPERGRKIESDKHYATGYDAVTVTPARNSILAYSDSDRKQDAGEGGGGNWYLRERSYQQAR
jgi:hypothetical protein